MLKRVTSVIAMVAIATTMGLAEARHGIIVYSSESNIEDKYNNMIEKKIEGIGFKLTDPHKRVNDVYKKKYGASQLDLLSFMTVVNDSKVKSLLNIDPRLAGFNPFDLFAYKKTAEKNMYVSHLTAESILEILHITDKKVREEYIASMKPLDELIKKEIGGKISYIDYTKIADDTMMNFEYDFERPEDLDDFIDEFQEKFEEAFEAKEYIIAGFFNFNEHFGDGPNPLTKFDAFWTYSLCHFTFSYNIFDTDNLRPEAGVFAPCTMYMYIEKGSNKLVIGMPRLANWAAMVNIKDKKRLEYISKLDTEIPSIMVSLGAKEVESTPFPSQTAATVETTTVVKKEKKVEKVVSEKVTARVVKTPSKSGTKVGDKISTFLVAPYASVAQVSADLEANGFSVLASHKVGDITTVVFTSPELKKMANRKNRGFASILRLTVDEKTKKISITNPLYFFKAYMQSDFRAVETRDLIAKLNNTFEGLKNSEDALEEDDLADFQFMMGMPYYKDMDVIAEGKNEELLAKVKASGKMIFEVKLENGSTLVGIGLSKRTAKFPTKIGTANASVLPYTVLIEKGEAKSLAPKYNIALFYPLLTMSKFMTIATIPGAITTELGNAFK